MTETSFVRSDMLPEQAAPASEVGLVGWARSNLFAGVYNTLLTLLSIAFVIWIGSIVIPWTFQSSWTASSLAECRQQIAAAYGEGTHGACWSVIRERFSQLVYGFYPQELRWRVNLTFVLMLVAVAPVLFPMVPRVLLVFSGVFPILAVWLLWGGSVWGPLLVLAGFLIAGAILVYGRLGQVLGLLVAVGFLLVWLFSIGWMTHMIDYAIAAGQYTEEDVAKEAELYETLASAEATLAEEEANLGGFLGFFQAEPTTAYTEAENAVFSADRTIRRFHAEKGFVGIEPVKSEDFGGFALSIIIGVTGIVASLPLGILLALGRQSNLFIIRTICIGFIELIRGVPLITLLFVASVLLNYFLPPGTNFDIILRVVILVTLFASAYMAEVVRGGLAALPRGQYEAADSLGLDYWKAQRLIIMPQALKVAIPNIVSTFIGLFKDTTLVSIIGLLDPIGLAKFSIPGDAAWQGIYLELYVFVAVVFFIFCYAMSRYSMYLEKRLKTDHR